MCAFLNVDVLNIIFIVLLLLLFEFDALTVNGRSVQVWIEFKSSQGTRSDDPL